MTTLSYGPSINYFQETTLFLLVLSTLENGKLAAFMLVTCSTPQFIKRFDGGSSFLA